MARGRFSPHVLSPSATARLLPPLQPGLFQNACRSAAITVRGAGECTRAAEAGKAVPFVNISPAWCSLRRGRSATSALLLIPAALSTLASAPPLAWKTLRPAPSVCSPTAALFRLGAARSALAGRIQPRVSIASSFVLLRLSPLPSSSPASPPPSRATRRDAVWRAPRPLAGVRRPGRRADRRPDDRRPRQGRE